MKVSEIMTKEVRCVTPDTSLKQAAEIMRDINVGSLPVCDDSGIMGIVTDRDIVVRSVAENKIAESETVKNIMTYNAATVSPSMHAEEAAKLMAKNRIRRIPVVENQAVVGIVSLGDLASDMRFDVEASEALAEISIPVK